MNTHEHVSIEILADYAEGLLGDADATAVAEHLASCADCQAEADLLVSVSNILAADDPGPMPAHYAARIDAVLADLAAAEPVAPKPRETTPVSEGAAVIDLASRRRFTPAARVTSVAASLVLLIGGVALGMQALDASDAGDPSGNNVAGPDIEAVQTPLGGAVNAALYALVEEPKGAARKKGKGGAIIDKNTGAVFIKNKVLFPDGTVVVHRKSGVAEVRTFSNGQVFVEQVPSPRRIPTNTPPNRPAQETPRVEPTPQRTPEPTPEPTPSPTPDPTVTPAPTSNPWVENSGDVYTPDDFATKVQALLRNSGDTIEAPSGPAGGGDQNRAVAGAVRAQDAAVKARGPAPAEVAAKVKRCANQLGLTDVLAADAGIWRGQSATILVTRLGATQATGYVVYGDCTKEAPATAADVQWEQRVDLPGKTEEPSPVPTTSPSNGAPINETATATATNSVSTSQEQ